MFTTLAMSVAALVMTAMVFAHVSPRAEARLEKLFMATLGALVGSLIGRVISDPRWVGHLFYIAAGAFTLSALDWIRRRYRSGGTRRKERA